MEYHHLRCKDKKEFDSIWTNRHTTNNFGEVTGYTKVLGEKRILRDILLEKQDILEEIIARPDVTTPKEVIEIFEDYTQPDVFIDDVYLGFTNYISKLKKEDRYSYSKSIQATLTNIKSYNDNKKLKFTSIDPQWLENYQTQRVKREGKSISSVGVDLRNLRTIYNQAKNQNESLKFKYPFGNNKFSIPESDVKNVSLSKDDINKIRDYSSPNMLLQQARDFWMFSYFGMGINIKDIAFLEKKKFKNHTIKYYRQKTKYTSKKPRELALVFNAEMIEILYRYEGSGKYLFNILDDFDNAEQIEKKISNRKSQIQKAMRKLGENLELPNGFSYQWARHSVATNLVRGNLDMKTIQDVFGHQKINTTIKYVDSLIEEKREQIDDALSLD